MIRTLQSLFTWIFYLFSRVTKKGNLYLLLQSLFTWIFYLFYATWTWDYQCYKSFNPYSPGFSIYFNGKINNTYIFNGSLNPYSPGFSIYLMSQKMYETIEKMLQSLFTWIFYLFNRSWKSSKLLYQSFNPYSPGFSIYLKNKRRKCRCKRKLQSLFTWIFYLFDDTYIDYWGDRLLQSLFTWIFYLFLFHDLQLLSNLLASILIHLDFLSI